MLRKILLVLVFVGLIAVVGCQKDEPAPTPPTTDETNQAASDIQDEAQKAADAAAKEADAAKQEAGKTLENLGKDLQK